MNNQLEQLANDILNNHGKKPNLTNRDFYNCVLIFQNAVLDKMYDLQEREKMDLKHGRKWQMTAVILFINWLRLTQI